MADKIHKTRAVILKNVKYGETSLVTLAYTELFGVQHYLFNGIRTQSKKGSTKFAFFQPAAILEMEVYHNEFKQLNRVKEYKWGYLYQTIFSDVLKNAVASYMVELLYKCLKQPEGNSSLFAFIEDCFMALDSCSDKVMANFPIFFSVHLSYFFGFLPRYISAHNLVEGALLFDIEEGVFTNQQLFHNLYLEKDATIILAEILKVRHAFELDEINTNATTRRKILEMLETYYNLHIQDFGKMKTLPVLRDLMKG